MLRHRVIPSLLLRNEGLVKTIQFGKSSYVGDPINAVKIFNEKEVDELIVLDIDATREGRSPNFAMAEELAGECFMPLCWGGGIRSVEDARTLFSLGVEKVAIRSASVDNPALFRAIADRAGEQAVVASIDVKKGGFFGGTQLLNGNGVKDKRSWQEAIQTAVAHGVGEIMLMSADHDGMRSGMNLELIREASALVDVPLIAAGGIGKIGHIKEAVDAGADAVAAGAWCVWQGPQKAVLITYPRYEELTALWD
jgi:imidazole glycerol-phosphate synthase subunit HisF